MHTCSVCVCVSKFGHQLSQPWLDVSQIWVVNNGIFFNYRNPSTCDFWTINIGCSIVKLFHVAQVITSKIASRALTKSQQPRSKAGWVLDGCWPPNITASNERQISLHLMKYILKPCLFFGKKMHGIILCRVKLKPKKHYNVENTAKKVGFSFIIRSTSRYQKGPDMVCQDMVTSASCGVNSDLWLVDPYDPMTDVICGMPWWNTCTSQTHAIEFPWR